MCYESKCNNSLAAFQTAGGQTKSDQMFENELTKYVNNQKAVNKKVSFERKLLKTWHFKGQKVSN